MPSGQLASRMPMASTIPRSANHSVTIWVNAILSSTPPIPQRSRPAKANA